MAVKTGNRPGGRARPRAGRGKKPGRRLVTNTKVKRTRRFDPTAPMTGRQIRRQARALTRVEFLPAERQLAQERRLADRRIQVLPEWQKTFQADTAAASQRATQAHQQAHAAVAAQANAARAQDAQHVSQTQAEAARLAAVRGTAPDPKLADEANRAAAARQALSNSFGGMLASQGSSQAAYLAALERIGGARGLQAMQDALDQRRALEREGRELASKKGAYRVKALNELTQRERDYLVNRTAYGVRLREAQAQENVAATHAGAKIGAARLNLRGIKQQGRNRAVPETTNVHQFIHGGRPDGATGSSIPANFVANYRRQLRKAIDLVGRSGQGRKQALNALQTRYNIDPFIAAVAYARVHEGGVLPETARRLRQDYGLSIRVRGRQRRAPLNRPPQARGPGGGRRPT